MLGRVGALISFGYIILSCQNSLEARLGLMLSIFKGCLFLHTFKILEEMGYMGGGVSLGCGNITSSLH